MSKVQFFGGCLGLLVAIMLHAQPATSVLPDLHKLTIVEKPNRVLLDWSGDIEKPMRDELAAALDKFRGDKRRIVISLNSPGGSIAHGEEVISAIRGAALMHPVDTLIKDGSVCASMCVSIFLTGAKRVSGADAQFMFHEASINVAADRAAGAAAGDLQALIPVLRKTIEKAATDAVFDSYNQAPRINSQWLKTIRAQIAGRDVWISGQKLVKDGSGVVDELLTGVE